MFSGQDVIHSPAGSSNRPLVTFAVFTYNQALYVREAVESVFAQTYEPLEIIISDDASTDDTFAIIENLTALYAGTHSVTVRRNERNLGLAGNINAALRSSNGELITWMGGDDIALPRRTDVLVSRLLDTSEAVGVHSNIEEIDLFGNSIRIRPRNRDQVDVSLDKVVLRGQSIITQSHAFKRHAFENFGPFREDLTHEGIAMAFREASIGKIVFVEEVLTKYRIGSGVSTYSGNEVNRRKKDEPIKYSNWYLSAYRQMLDDATHLPQQLSPTTIDAIERGIAFYSSLLEINRSERFVRPVIRNLLIAPRDLRSIRAAVRAAFPGWLYGCLLRQSRSRSN